MHNSVERENPIQNAGEQDFIEKLFVEGKKNLKWKSKEVEGAGLTFQLHSTDTPTEKGRVYILMIFVWLTH